MISPLTLMEVLSVLRVQKGREKQKLKELGTSEKQLDYVLKESNDM